VTAGAAGMSVQAKNTPKGRRIMMKKANVPRYVSLFLTTLKPYSPKLKTPNEAKVS
jgi:hypothetical protein